MSEIRIRHSKPSDLDGIKAIYAQPHAYGDTLQLPYPSDESWEKRLAEVSDHCISLVAEVDGRVLGQLTLELVGRPRRKHVATFGMGVARDAQGHGVGSALVEAALDLADNWLNVHRMEVEVYADNERAVGLYEKFGFEVEGRCRDYAFRDGKYVDALVMARLR